MQYRCRDNKEYLNFNLAKLTSKVKCSLRHALRSMGDLVKI